MKRLVLRLFLSTALISWLTLGTAGFGQKKPLPVFRITGVVLNGRDGSPVRRCVMTASLVSGGRGEAREPVVATTDESGHFALEVPSAGNWELSAEAHNIRSQPFDVHDGYFTGIILTAQAPTYNVVFRAWPDALLAGVVTDEAGEAVRNAQITLYWMRPESSQEGFSPMQERGHAQTDDRGRYEVAGLEAGGYMVEVQARPWYASNGGPPAVVTAGTTPDPSLDVVYPAMWFPGVADADAAEVLTAHAGDVLQADFRLGVQPAGHLVVQGGAGVVNQVGRPRGIGGQNANVSLVLPDGSLQPVFGPISRTPNGDLDVSGLASGTYRVTFSGEGADRTTTVRVEGGSSLSVSPDVPKTEVTIGVDGGASVDASQIVLVDKVTNQTFSGSGRGGGDRPSVPGPPRGGGSAGRPDGRMRQPNGGRGRARFSDGEEVTFQVPPGRYDVTVRGVSSAFVTGLTASKGAEAVGRTVSLPEGVVHLAVHLASGFATVSGSARLDGKASVGAMVLLVPATLGDPASLAVVRRDQTNSDGSFRLDDVIPGQYILVSIDQGWGLKWSDPATLRPYLLQGMPLELHSSAAASPKMTSVRR